MRGAGVFARHRVAIASNTALLVAAGAVLAYAVAADGYQAHEAQLNDGGIWVVHGDRGIYGRINKPINQLDTVVFNANGGDRSLDIVQDGAVVVALDKTARTAQVIDPVTSQLVADALVSVPTDGVQQAAGSSLASIDRETGDLWAVRLDPQRGDLQLDSLEAQSDPLVSVGERAALAVSQSGDVVATSAEEGTITYVVHRDDGFATPRTRDLPSASGEPSAVTTVGDEVVTFDETSGQLSVIGGGSVTLARDLVLQQPGPAASSVLVADSASVLAVDLDTGSTRVIADAASGTPTEPVRLGACSYAAWSGGQGTVAVQCGDGETQSSRLDGNASALTFRVNRGEIVLNDDTSGAVWDLDSPQPEKIDNWNAFTASKRVEDDDKKNDEQSSGDRTPPKAEPDQYGVRAGRTTILHPLDNDSAPQGRLLSIVDLGQPTGGATAQISPDGQTVVLQMPERARSTSFEYTIDDGRSSFSAHAAIEVGVRAETENEQPSLRAGFEPHRWQVPARGSMTVPVLSDWRDDKDGDTLVLDRAIAVGVGNSGAVARATSDGRVRFTGSREGGDTVQVEVEVSDGRTAPVKQVLTFDVQARLDRTTFPAVAEPDVVRGEVNTPIKITPLLNDLPGSDPATPNAELELGGKIPAQPGTSIKTDVEDGVVTFSADRPGTYFMDYDAAFGYAALARATIRVDVLPVPKSPGDPVAMPDTLTVFGQSAAVIDVLANDLDPAGGLLVVQGAEAESPDQLDVTVIDGRWLRVSARRGEMSPNPQLVRYSISNGSASGIEGEVTVSHRQVPADNFPVTTTDRVHVRAGSSVSIPVLDNDIAPSGDRLTLVADAAEGIPGELDVSVPPDVKGDVGTALVSGRTVRYIAPDLKERDSFDVHYIARSSTGETTTGKVIVTITPRADPNTPPEPPTLEGRAVSAATIKIRLPGSGVDPEGDPVTVAGITSAPRLGRVLSYGGNFLEYQAYPRTAGTDEFEYSVVDGRGGVATGVVRVAVVPPVQPQPPLAVADELTVEPGRTAVFDPLANDYVAPGDEVRLSLVDAPSGVSLDPKTDLISVPAPETMTGESPQIVYAITNGIDRSIATLSLETASEFENPPVVFDAFGRANDSGSVTVDVLEGAYDPDGTVEGLSVTKVYGAEGDPRISPDGAEISVDRGPNPIVVPFRVEDANGAAATASIYVPPTGTGIPYVKPGALIELDEGGSARGKLSDVIVNPSGTSLRLTRGSSVTASPADLEPTRSGDDGFLVSASEGYRGPGALLLEVTTATDPAGNEDPQDPTDGYTALLSVPVQVGDDTPELECSRSTIPISAGEVYDDIASLCNVWTPDPADAVGLPFEASWAQEVEGLSVDGTGTSALRVAAAEDVPRGQARLSVTVGGSEPAEISFRVTSAPPPSMLPIRSEDLDAGQSRELDLARYLLPGVADPTPSVVSIALVSGVGVTARPTGQAGVTLVASDQAQGRAVFRVVMSDVDDASPSAERRAEGRIEVTLAGRPGQPGTPWAKDNEEKGVVRVGWYPPEDDGGSPVTSYVLREMQTGDKRTCRTNECNFGGLKNRQNYNFRVAAVNKIGIGPWSDLSQTAYADTKPGRVSNIRMVDPGDHTLTLVWTKPESSTPIEAYRVSWMGKSVAVPGNTPTYTVTGLDNNQTYNFSVEALNSVNWSPPRQSAPFQSVGTPAAPLGLGMADRESGAGSTDVVATWAPTAPEGPAPTLYTLTYSAAGAAVRTVPGCSRIQSTTCAHAGVPYDGTTYAYYVQAHNIKQTSPPSVPASFQAVGRPAAWGAWSATPTGLDQQVRVEATSPDPRGKAGRAQILVNDQVAWEGPVVAGQSISRTVSSTGTDGTPSAVQLLLCNEFAAQRGCTPSEVRPVQTFGPLRPVNLTRVEGFPDRDTMGWVVEGNSNGQPAQITITSGKRSQTIQVPAGEWFVQSERVQVGWETTEEVTVTLTDPANGRGPVSMRQSATTGSPPAPQISLSKGDACLDGSEMTWPGPTCASRGWATEACTEVNCAFINFSISGFVNAYTCRITRSGRSPIDFGVVPAENIARSNYHYGSAPLAARTVSIYCQTLNSEPIQQSVRSADLVW